MDGENGTFIIRSACEADVSAIDAFLRPFAEQQQILPRTEEDIRRCLGNFQLAFSTSGKLVGTVALRDFGEGLHEIRSLTVLTEVARQGLGSRLVEAAKELARARKAKRVFTLTTHPALFQRVGFRIVPMDTFPQKVQFDCRACPKRHACDETALLWEP